MDKYCSCATAGRTQMKKLEGICEASAGLHSVIGKNAGLTWKRAAPLKWSQNRAKYKRVICSDDAVHYRMS